VWFSLTSFLANAAMISKYLNPVGKLDQTKKERKSALRSALEVESDSEVLHRKARDNVEHFDERIDNWARQGAGNIIEIVLDTRLELDRFLRAETRVKRALILQEGIFLSEDRHGTIFELELKPVLIEIQRIGQKANEWIDNESPYHFIYPHG
jgi:hypothetical protein